jgi:hypothetical protein
MRETNLHSFIKSDIIEFFSLSLSVRFAGMHSYRNAIYNHISTPELTKTVFTAYPRLHLT